LALDVYRQVAESDSNFVISPLSLMNATAALYLGTSARTRTEFGHASHLDAIAARRLIAAAREVRSGWMNSRRGVSLGIEDTLISPPNADLRQAWLDQIARGWGVQHRQTQENVGTEWTRFDIVSRVEFKGKWQYAFDPSWTRDADFYGAHGQSEPVRMMRLEESLRYQPLPEAAVRLLGLPYRGGQLELVIVLPDEREGLWELERKLTPELLARFNPATKQKVDLYLPRFQLQSNIDLTEALGGLGVKRLWEQGAEFEAMFMHPSDTRAVPTGTQEAFMEVTEEGTVAAAITHYAVVDFADGHPSEQPIRFEVDHPFWVVLRHVQTKRILFMGRVVHPNYTPATDSTRTSPAPSRAPAAPTPRRRPPIDVGN
jgi:serine protease inhibitor